MKTKTTTRLCRRCKKDKPLEDYYEDSRVKKDGRRAVCKECLSTGNPCGPKPMNPLTRYKVDERGCWIWQGAVKGSSRYSGAYGSIKWNGKGALAHRVVYELVKGEIPKGMFLDHTCSVKLCVNPDHLEPVTHRENIQRAWSRQHCATCTCEIPK